MKKLFLLGALLVSVLSFAQNELTASDWQADLKFLQDKVHTDYPFLFKKTTKADFDAAVKKLHAGIPSMEDHEIVMGFARIVSSFEYGHTRLGFQNLPVKLHRVPLNLYAYNDGIYIQGVHKDHASLAGAKLLKVEGMPVEDALAAVRPVVPVENDQYFKAFGLNYVCYPEVLHAQGVTKALKPDVTMTFQKDGKTFDKTLTAIEGLRPPFKYSLIEDGDEWVDARDDGETPLYLKNLDKIYFYEYLPDNKTVYVRHSQIQDDPSEDIPTFYNRVFDFIENNDVERLIIDVRLNGGGNNYKNKPIITGIIESKVNEQGKLFVILGRRTFSACQNLVNEMSNYTNAIFVGEPTSENINFYGDNQEVVLPNSKMSAFLSFAWWQDKPQWENDDWLAPHAAVDMSFDDYKSNRDPVLDMALNFKGEEFVSNPMLYFTDLFTQGKIEQLKTDAARMVKDPMYKFFDFEGQFNNAGYRLLGGNQVQEAIFVFQLIAQLYPDSANAWDSLAEGYMTAGDKDKAREYYNKAISLDPNGSVGDNARSMLKRLEK